MKAAGLSNTKSAILVVSLVIEVLIPVGWITFGAVVPTIPAVASSLVCCLGITALLPFTALVTLFIAPRIGRTMSILALAWAGILAGFLIIEELIRAAVTDFPDPAWLTVTVIMTGLIILVGCAIEIAWLVRAMRGHVG